MDEAIPCKLPRFFNAGDYAEVLPAMLEVPHRKQHFAEGDFLWAPGEPLTHCHYILSGVAKMEYIHEDGHTRILDLHGPGALSPECSDTPFRIERSLCLVALTDAAALTFKRDNLHALAAHDPVFATVVIETYAHYINVLIYQLTHQDYNELPLRIVNLLYLLARENEGHEVRLTQGELAQMLGTNRVNVAKTLGSLKEEGIIESGRRHIAVKDMVALAARCTEETRQ